VTLSNYIDYGGSLRLTQPYLAKHVGFFGFALKANVNSLQSLCDLRLNAPAGKAVRFEPSGPFIILAFNSLNQLSSKNPPDSEKGWFSEKEFAVWMPVIDRVQEKSYWFHPYIFVDNPYALALGREVYGFPKSLGVFDIPEKPDASASLSMKTWIIPRYAPDSQGVLTELVKISPVSEGKGTLWSWLEDMEEFTAEVTGMLRAQESIVGDIELAVRTVDDLLHRRAPMVFLKQFPDASHAEKACYMSLVEAPSNMTAFQHGGLLHTSYEVTFTPCDSHPIVSDLGLTSASVEPIISFYVEFDFEIDNGVEIWRA
jgi:acetoacetate decarboxylase